MKKFSTIFFCEFLFCSANFLLFLHVYAVNVCDGICVPVCEDKPSSNELIKENISTNHHVPMPAYFMHTCESKTDPKKHSIHLKYVFISYIGPFHITHISHCIRTIFMSVTSNANMTARLFYGSTYFS